MRIETIILCFLCFLVLFFTFSLIFSFSCGRTQKICGFTVNFPTKNWVTGCDVGDINGDGVFEWGIGVWKRGNFGPSKPFWVEEDDLSYRNHFFVYSPKSGLLKPLWMSSNLEEPNCWFMFLDVDEDGSSELVTAEGEYSDKQFLDRYFCEVKKIGAWDWSDWGFYRKQSGKFYPN